jgi:copper chaperone NosL
MNLLYTATLLPFLALAGCKDDVTTLALPAAVTLDEEAAGYYCQMVILDHPGPKAQVHLAGMGAPLWFSQVRDGLAYLKSPDQSAEIRILYVSDMGAAPDWDAPGADNWIDAATATYVVGSDALGGMAAPELVPFSDAAQAMAFAKTHGGSLMALDDIPRAAVLAPLDGEPETGHDIPGHNG